MDARCTFSYCKHHRHTIVHHWQVVDHYRDDFFVGGRHHILDHTANILPTVPSYRLLALNQKKGYMKIVPIIQTANLHIFINNLDLDCQEWWIPFSSNNEKVQLVESWNFEVFPFIIKLDSYVSDTFPPYVPRPICATPYKRPMPYMCHALYEPCPIMTEDHWSSNSKYFKFEKVEVAKFLCRKIS